MTALNRGVALVGVILGDWLVTGFAIRDSGHLVHASLPIFSPFAALFLLGRRSWRPVRVFALAWAPALLWLVLVGTAPETIGTIVMSVLAPLAVVLLCAVAPPVDRTPTWLDRHAVSLFLWHQTALLLATVGCFALPLLTLPSAAAVLGFLAFTDQEAS